MGFIIPLNVVIKTTCSAITFSSAKKGNSKKDHEDLRRRKR